MREANEMNEDKVTMTMRVLLAATLAFSLAAGTAQAQGKNVQKTFASAENASQALIQATSDYDVSALMQIFGPEGQDFITSADPVRDKNTGAAFAALANQKNAVVIDPKAPNRATLLVGNNGWPF